MYRSVRGLAVGMLFSIVLLYGPSTHAEACDATGVELLNVIDAQIIKHSRWVSEFTQSNHTEALSAPLTSGGLVYVDAEQGVAWQVQNPIQNTLIINQQGINLGNGMMQSTRMVSELLRALILGRLARLENSFTVKGCLEASSWRLLLYPKQEELAARISQLKLAGDQWVNQLSVSQTNGNDIVIHFSPPQVLEKMPDEIAVLLNVPGT